MISNGSKLYFQDVRLLHIHALNSCNLRCCYCSVSASSHEASSTTVTPQQCLEIVECALAAIAPHRLQVEIMGGEQLLLGKAWFEEVLGDLERLAQRSGQAVQVHFTTNGTLLDDQWAAMFRRYRVRITVSLDGPEEVHNGQRGLFQQVVAGIQALKRHGIDLHAIAVATAPVLERVDDLLTLYESLGIRSFHLCDVRDYGKALGIQESLVPTPPAMLKATLRVLDHMQEHRLALSERQLLDRVFRYCDDRYFDNFCTHPTCPAGTRFVSVDAFGNVYPCPNETSPDHRLGNLYSEADPTRRDRVLRDYHAKSLFHLSCLQCRASKICFFACTASLKRTMRQAERECEYTQLLFEHFQGHEPQTRGLYGLAKALQPTC